MADWILHLNVRDANDTGSLSVNELNVGEKAFRTNHDDDTVLVSRKICKWLITVLKPYQFRNLYEFMQVEVDKLEPEDKEDPVVV